MYMFTSIFSNVPPLKQRSTSLSVDTSSHCMWCDVYNIPSHKLWSQEMLEYIVLYVERRGAAAQVWVSGDLLIFT